jgi:xanthine dehydrogenase YagR molybdenum-binding subunit
MRFDTPAGTNPIDQLKVVGKPTDRIDGPLKTTGRAPYAYEYHDAVPHQAYGVVVGSAIAKGRISSMHLSDAESAPGVICIVTAANAGKLGKGKYNTAVLLGGPDIQHYHQAVALVVAETFEQARAAAQLIQIDYSRTNGMFDLSSSYRSGVEEKEQMADVVHGDFDGAFAAAVVRLDETYTTPDQSHAMMEPFASMASWKGDELTIWTSNQMIDWAVSDVATTLGVPKKKVRLDFPVCRRWVRRQAFRQDRCSARSAWFTDGGQAGKGRPAATADHQQYNASSSHHSTYTHRCRP